MALSWLDIVLDAAVIGEVIFESAVPVCEFLADSCLAHDGVIEVVFQIWNTPSELFTH